MDELVSIIMPTYNCGKFIAETIRSAQAQTYANWELIVVDDCSTDDTEATVRGLCDSRIRYDKLRENSGAAVARTRAMELANGKYMAFLDSDDLWAPEKLARQIAFMERNDCAFTCTSYDQIDEGGTALGRIIRAKPRTNYNGMLLSCPVGNSSVMYDAGKLGKFSVPNIRKRNDDALWLAMLKVEPNIVGIDEILMHYRIRSNSISSRKTQLVKYHWILYREIEKLPLWRCVFHVGFWVFLKVFHIK